MRNLWRQRLGGAALALWAASPLVGPARAQQPLNPPVPLAAQAPALAPGAEAASLAAAQSAHDLGLPSVAAGVYRRLLDAPGGDASRVKLALATALLDAGRPGEARQALATIPEPHEAAWRLRDGLAALQLRQREAAQAAWDAIKADEIAAEDRPWYWFLTGALYDTATPREVTRANDFYRAAENEAATELARARFQLAAEQVRLHDVAPPTDEQLRAARQNAEKWQGLGYGFAKDYVAMLARRNQGAEAIAWLNRELLSMPPQQREWRDEFLFLLGLLADRSRNGPGRLALVQLLATGAKPERQRQALQLLADASPRDPERGQFRAELRRLIDARQPHPILDALLYYRARLALADNDFRSAETDAERLARDFAASPLRPHAYVLLAESAWEQGRFRLAATNAGRAREALAAAKSAAPVTRAELGVLEAEASFRAGMQTREQTGPDFRAAADAYAALLRERPPGLKPEQVGGLMFQHVLAEIRASADAAGTERAIAVLDGYARDAAFDLESRWEAEWSLARALQLRGQIPAALERVNALLAATGEGAAQLPASLRVRVAWLQTRLAFEAEKFSEALALLERLRGSLDQIEPKVRDEVASTALLLKGRIELRLGNEAAALQTFKTLRAELPKTDAAIYSYLVEESHFESQGKIQEAQLRLTAITDHEAYKTSEYVPFALIELARLSEQLGQLQSAVRYVEQFAGNPQWANHELLFTARLKQGDLLRRLNQLPQAQQIYEELVNKFSQRPDVVYAQLRLAETHNALSATDDPQNKSHEKTARIKFEELRDRFDAPPDVRVEAGYNLGLLLARAGDANSALTVWWRDVIKPFLIDAKDPIESGAKRPYWLARTLLGIGELIEQQANGDATRLEEAKRAYQLVLDYRLGAGESFARKNLERLGVRVSAAP